MEPTFSTFLLALWNKILNVGFDLGPTCSTFVFFSFWNRIFKVGFDLEPIFLFLILLVFWNRILKVGFDLEPTVSAFVVGFLE